MLGETHFQAIRVSIESLETAVKYAKPADLVDCTARLRQVCKHVEEINESWSNTIKKKLEATNEGVLEGSKFTAELHRSTRNLLDTEKVKKYLGRNLYKFMNVTQCNQLRFKPRE